MSSDGQRDVSDGTRKKVSPEGLDSGEDGRQNHLQLGGVARHSQRHHKEAPPVSLTPEAQAGFNAAAERILRRRYGHVWPVEPAKEKAEPVAAPAARPLP